MSYVKIYLFLHWSMYKPNLEQLQNTPQLIYMSLNKNSVYCVMPRSSKPPDTCKWGGPKLRGILKFSLDDSTKVISISTLGLDPFVSRHVEINFFCLVFQAPCQKFVVSHWGKTSSLVASGSSSTNSKAWKSGPKSKESTACVHKRKRTDVKEKPTPSKA